MGPLKHDAASHRPKSAVSMTLSNLGDFKKSLAILIEIINVQTSLNLDLTFCDSYIFRETTEEFHTHTRWNKRSGLKQLYTIKASRFT